MVKRSPSRFIAAKEPISEHWRKISVKCWRGARHRAAADNWTIQGGPGDHDVGLEDCLENSGEQGLDDLLLSPSGLLVAKVELTEIGASSFGQGSSTNCKHQRKDG